ncbi:MAG: PilT/PilU family type 4a pilus ATPase [Kiritimatiellae bacterium]|nr:PilT/PilU family type 4a pilus ATPase [Kiritimatiellia bacterium]
MSILRELLDKAISLGASDIHLKPEREPVFRVHSEIVSSEHPPISAEQMKATVAEILPEHTRRRYEVEHEADFSMEEPGVGRFRVNVFVCHGVPSVALRHVKTEIPSFESLHLPPILQSLALIPRGIVLASGTTGCGKSTTLAAMIRHINDNRKCRVITIEDPIEYLFVDKRAVISQREVGLDTMSFHAALKHVLRQDPDVIMIGEMRDAESFMAALTAAETGHIVFTTLHTGSAAQSVHRILDFFPSAERDQIRMSLAANMRAVICQRLIPGVRIGVVPAVEVLINTPTVRKLMEKNHLEKLEAAIETGVDDGMQTFNQAIYQLIKSGMVTEENGLMRASNPEALKMNLKGIFLDEARRILST